MAAPSRTTSALVVALGIGIGAFFGLRHEAGAKEIGREVSPHLEGPFVAEMAKPSARLEAHGE